MTTTLKTSSGQAQYAHLSKLIATSLVGMSLITGGCAEDGAAGEEASSLEGDEMIGGAASHQGAAESITLEKAEHYLRQFGYLGKEPKATDRKTQLAEGLRLFQEIHQLPADGTLNEATRQRMAKPRCAEPDHALVAKYRGGSDGQPSASFVPLGSVWSNRALSYRHVNYTLDMLPVEIESVFADAVEVWRAANPSLSFTKITTGAGGDILASFEPQFHMHGSDPADFGGNVLAHAFSPAPNLGGDVHFNDSWLWTEDGFGGQDLMSVSLHELGHSLGLGHTNVDGSVMLPIDGGLHALGADDILGINTLYPPPAPALTNYNGACYGENNAAWTAQSNTTRYELYRSSSASFSSQVLVYSGLDTYQSLNVPPGGWHLRVRACNSVVCGPYSSTQFAAYVNSCL